MRTQLRLVLVVSILASFVAFLDGSVINVALPSIAHELGGGLATQQWVVDSYLITLGALILIAGSLSDIFGRKRILASGLIGFAVSSLLCALAPTSEILIIARALQGVAGALLVPSSLALIISTYKGPEQSKAIGSWTAWTGISFVVGPLVGGALVDGLSWRYIFVLNFLPVLVTLWLMRGIHEPKNTHANTHVDIIGAVLCTVGLGGPVFALIEQGNYGWSSPIIYLPLIVGITALATFLWHEAHTSQPMLPLSLFASRNFSAGNIATASIYGGLAIATFLLSVFLQQVAGYSAVLAGLALLPVTIIMFVLSSRFGALAGKHGPRLFMTIGPIVAGISCLTMLMFDAAGSYWLQLLPGIILFGVGLSITVAPLTAAILGAIDARHAGVASAVNNAIARIAGLITVAAIGVVTGSVLTTSSFHTALIVVAGLLVVGGIISAIGIRNKVVPAKVDHVV